MLVNQKTEGMHKGREHMLQQKEDYHVAELRIALDRQDERHNLPKISAGLKVLDIGCGAGQTLIAACPYRVPPLASTPVTRAGQNCIECVRDCTGAKWAFGLDIDPDALGIGMTWSDRIEFACGSGDSLPYRSESFDMVISRVSIVFMDLRKAFAEMRRVLRPGGELWVTGMDFRATWTEVLRSNWKRKLVFVYVLSNSILFHLLQRQFRVFGRMESFQTELGIKRALKKAGFVKVSVRREEGFFEVSARIPSAAAAD